ncbi:hypothetical protein [Candidatus Proelusimicrobium excrementi]|uniref:hypothetical protein n=1 Tax=Candidatus Proelusimicrobium excrementi TaxID=3416222 RepID=UPI003D123B3E
MTFDNTITTKDNDLYVAEDDDFMANIDYDEMLKGIEASREDFRCGRYSDIKTSMERTRRMLFGK